MGSLTLQLIQNLARCFAALRGICKNSQVRPPNPEEKEKKQIVDQQIARLGVAKKPGESSTGVLDEIWSELNGLKSEIELATSSFLEKVFKPVKDLEREKEDNIRVQVRLPTFSKIREYADSRVMGGRESDAGKREEKIEGNEET